MPLSTDDLALYRRLRDELRAYYKRHGTKGRPGIQFELARLDRMIRNVEDRCDVVEREPVIQRDG
jgi:hypothetical protein